MKASLLLKSVPLTGLSLVLVSGCAYHAETVYQGPRWPARRLPVSVDSGVARNQPVMPTPAAASIAEQQNNPAPGPGYIWVAGTWLCQDYWTWEPGRWVYSPNRASIWGSGHYFYPGGRNMYIQE